MIENMIDIVAPTEKVFDFVVDIRNEPQWNPQLLQAELLTPVPIQTGAMFRAKFGRGVGEALIEDLKINRPHSWEAISRSRALDAHTEGQIDETSSGSRLIMRTQLRPHGILRLLTPALNPWMQRMLDQDMRRIKIILEGGPH
jgi:hypothetical protein